MGKRKERKNLNYGRANGGRAERLLLLLNTV